MLVQDDIYLEPNVINMKLWVDALESGQYKQGSQLLRFNDEYCCLGVACEVAIKHGVTIDTYQDSEGIFNYNEDSELLPGIVAKWLFKIPEGSKVPNNIYIEDTGEGLEGTYLSATSANDDSELDFSEIASLVREYYNIPR